MPQPSLTLVRRLNAAPQKVFAALTEPVHLTQWMHPGDTTCTHAETDLRVGGMFRVVMRSPDGTEHDVSGVYREIVVNEKLVFTWTWRDSPDRETLVTVLLRPVGDATELTLTHERFADEADRDSHQEGWSSGLDTLVALFD